MPKIDNTPRPAKADQTGRETVIEIKRWHYVNNATKDALKTAGFNKMQLSYNKYSKACTAPETLLQAQRLAESINQGKYDKIKDILTPKKAAA